MTPRQIEVLTAIDGGAKTPANIATKTNRQRQDISQVLRVLEGLKCIEFERDMADRRSFRYSVTGIGKIALEQV